jgi:hypothetical protein
MNSVSGLDKRLQEVLTRPEFLEMRGVAKEVTPRSGAWPDPCQGETAGAAVISPSPTVMTSGPRAC